MDEISKGGKPPKLFFWQDECASDFPDEVVLKIMKDAKPKLSKKNKCSSIIFFGTGGAMKGYNSKLLEKLFKDGL